MIVAIDGPSGSGKSSVARLLAARLRFWHLDTGAIYRAFTLRAMRRGADMRDARALAALIEPGAVVLEPTERRERVLLDGADVTDEIRTPLVTGEIHWLADEAIVRD